jgi:glutathione S-transferase
VRPDDHAPARLPAIGERLQGQAVAHTGCIPFERIEYDIDRGETRTSAFLENVNANGRIPVLETETGEFLPESNAILFYLAEGTPFLPDDRFDKAQALRWMFFEQYSHEPNIAVARAWLHVFDTEMTEERQGALEVKQELGHDALGVMEKHLKGRQFFVGGRYSVADIALYSYTHVADEGASILRTSRQFACGLSASRRSLDTYR